MNAQLVIKLEKQVTGILNPIFSGIRGHMNRLHREKKAEIAAGILKSTTAQETLSQFKSATENYGEVSKKGSDSINTMDEDHMREMNLLKDKQHKEKMALREANTAALEKAHERVQRFEDKLSSLGLKTTNGAHLTDIMLSGPQRTSYGEVFISLWSVMGLRKPAHPRDDTFSISGNRYLTLTPKKDEEVGKEAYKALQSLTQQIEDASEELKSSVLSMWAIESKEELHEALEDVNLKKRALKGFLKSTNESAEMSVIDLPEI